ncbi:hypothetical protein PT974_03131 [Cladobotryum mycophilum]|uniref:Uncharacterized protein n=1 Tax=Cladobotryum mycophilum TaxID=491253 RepID=A0ABR0SRJ2_9HYPO
MSAYAGVQGYEVLSSVQQQERGTAEGPGLARKPSATPVYLSRVLYIPSHGNLDFHLLVHDVSAEYKHAVKFSPLGGSDIIGEAFVGSRLFMTRLGNLKKPAVDTNDSEAQYVVDARFDTKAAYITVQNNETQNQSLSTRISLPLNTDDFRVTGKDGADISIGASFPVPDTTSSIGTFRHPFFRFSPGDGQKTLEWQIDPLVSGSLRYTLVEVDSGLTEDESQSLQKSSIIKAIYHHIGQGISLSMKSSEGVLLLPKNAGSETELVILASIIGLLWRIRSIEVKPVVGNASSSDRKSFLQRVFQRD